MSIYDHIAHEEGLLFTIWGPCFGDGRDPCDCPSCKNADKIASEGKDWDEEFEKAMSIDRANA